MIQVKGLAHIGKTQTALGGYGVTITEGSVVFGVGNTLNFIRDPDRNVIELTQLSVDKALRQARGAER